MLQFFGLLGAIALTAICWGVYGPVLHFGQNDLHSSLRPFVCVGLAYFLIAVLAPLLLIMRFREKGSWTVQGVLWSLLAGSAGAMGALGIILALRFGGNPVYVMPLVFGGAPVVNTLLTAFMSKSFDQLKAPFLAGLILVVLGAVTVLLNKPAAADHSKQAAEHQQKSPQEQPADSLVAPEHTDVADATDATIVADTSEAPSVKPVLDPVRRTTERFFEILLSVALTMVSWGAYGPVLHRGQTAMQGSRLRPLICIGMAYFVIAVVVPMTLLVPLADTGIWNTSGVLWSVAAGGFGAVGALGIILAFNCGGKPFTVMPLVFGLAPVVNTLSTMVLKGTDPALLSPWFLAGMLIVAVGAATVLVFGPRGPRTSPEATKLATEIRK